nr:hypothetical protein L204_01962 [Cryptococcus depauperatus CBS 7855]
MGDLRVAIETLLEAKRMYGNLALGGSCSYGGVARASRRLSPVYTHVEKQDEALHAKNEAPGPAQPTHHSSPSTVSLFHYPPFTPDTPFSCSHRHRQRPRRALALWTVHGVYHDEKGEAEMVQAVSDAVQRMAALGAVVRMNASFPSARHIPRAFDDMLRIVRHEMQAGLADFLVETRHAAVASLPELVRYNREHWVEALQKGSSLHVHGGAADDWAAAVDAVVRRGVSCEAGAPLDGLGAGEFVLQMA